MMHIQFLASGVHFDVSATTQAIFGLTDLPFRAEQLSPWIAFAFALALGGLLLREQREQIQREETVSN